MTAKLFLVIGSVDGTILNKLCWLKAILSYVIAGMPEKRGTFSDNVH